MHLKGSLNIVEVVTAWHFFSNLVGFGPSNYDWVWAKPHRHFLKRKRGPISISFSECLHRNQTSTPLPLCGLSTKHRILMATVVPLFVYPPSIYSFLCSMPACSFFLNKLWIALALCCPECDSWKSKNELRAAQAVQLSHSTVNEAYTFYVRTSTT